MASAAVFLRDSYLDRSVTLKPIIDLNSKRASEARLSRTIGKTGYRVCLIITLSLSTLAILVGFYSSWRYSFFIFAVASVFLLPAIWWKNYLSVLPAAGKDLESRLSLDVLSRLDPKKPLTVKTVFDCLQGHWQSGFLLHHLLLTSEMVETQLIDGGEDMVHRALTYATLIADNSGSSTIEPGYIVAGLLKISPEISQLLVSYKGSDRDIDSVVNWLARKLAEEEKRKNRRFGGVGRDWSFGFTPLLDRFGTNISLSIQKYGAYFGWLTESEAVLNIEKAFNNQAASVALVGQVGIGKSNSVYALAQKLIEGKTVPSLAYHQIISISASTITSAAKGQGELESIMVSLANEASHAGHIILFFDDAELFFTNAAGSVDATKILLSIIEHRSVPIIMALNPNDYERLKSTNASLASLITPIVMKELDQNGVMRVLEDQAIGLENQHHILVTYESLKSAYSLSGRYDHDSAYPGKAIKLLTEAISNTNQAVLSSKSVEEAVEQSRGIKVSSAAPVEASELLQLEDTIHARMINQNRAVSVVASSLRRARAGVNNPSRPIGSFLFLGPTGVGKTELAKSLAATYFKSESNMIRLDMSEYQNAEDLNRLLSDGKTETTSLIMSVREKPFSVVLLDEVEKAHPSILNILLQLLDEGQLTDSSGRQVSFKDCIIIATSNAGAQSIRQRVQKGEELESFEAELIEEIISSNTFKPELINRFDEIVLFRPLKPEELVKVVVLMLSGINQTLATQNISVSLTDAAIQKIVKVGYDPRLGARPMRRVLQKAVEDTVAQKILKNEAKAGDKISLDEKDLLL